MDYFCERPYLPKDIEPTFPITKIFGEVRVPNAPGRLFVVPVGPLSLDYMAKLDDLRTYATTAMVRGLWSFFFREITEQLQPDIILVDSRAGIQRMGEPSLCFKLPIKPLCSSTPMSRINVGLIFSLKLSEIRYLCNLFFRLSQWVMLERKE